MAKEHIKDVYEQGCTAIDEGVMPYVHYDFLLLGNIADCCFQRPLRRHTVIF